MTIEDKCRQCSSHDTDACGYVRRGLLRKCNYLMDWEEGYLDAGDDLSREITDEEALELCKSYCDFLAKGLTEGKKQPIGPEWMKENIRSFKPRPSDLKNIVQAYSDVLTGVKGLKLGIDEKFWEKVLERYNEIDGNNKEGDSI